MAYEDTRSKDFTFPTEPQTTFQGISGLGDPTHIPQQPAFPYPYMRSLHLRGIFPAWGFPQVLPQSLNTPSSAA